MGNPFANGIHGCQIKKLYEYLRKLIAPELSVVFWLDTLCVPPPQTEYMAARKEAINTMRDIYSESDKVLVLDAEIMNSPVDVKDLELMIRVISSGWMRRLWTLQESVLNRSQTFAQFDGRAVLVDQLVDSIMHQMNGMTLGERMFSEGVQVWVNIQEALKNIKSLWNAAQFRTTSKQSDESICLATTLCLSLDSVMNISGLPGEVATLRMQEFLRLQRLFPVEFLFVTGERMQDPGYRWSPLSFIGRQKSVMMNVTCAMGEFVDHSESDHEKGFFCEVVSAFRISPRSSDRRVKNVVWFRCHRDTYRVTHSLGPNPGPSPEDLKIDQLTSPAVLLSGTITREQGAIGALVNIKRDSDGNGRIHAQYHT
jgi:hypothetical protein